MPFDEADNERVQYVEQRYSRIQSYRELYNKRVIDNIAQYSGKHWSFWNPTLNRLQELKPGRLKTAPRRTYNLQLPMIMLLANKVNSRDPTFMPIPATTDSEDVYSAAVGYRVSLSELRSLGMYGYERLQWIIAALVCADAFLKIVWDADAGEEYEFEDGVQRGGDLKAFIRTPLEVGIDPFATSMKDARWIMEMIVRPREWVEQEYPGVSVGGLGEDNTATYQLALRSVMGNQDTIHYRPEEETVLVKEFYERPTREHPKGQVITVCNGKLLDYKDKNPYGDFPFVHFGAYPMVGRFWSKSPIEFTMPAQQGVELAMAQIEEYHQKVNPKVLVQEGSLADGESISNLPFDVIKYKRGQAPPIVQAPTSISAEAYSFVNQYIALFERVSGINPASQGQQPPGTRSAEQLNVQIEQDHQKFAPLVFRFEDAMQDVVRKVIRYNQKFRAIPKLIQIVGRQNAFKVQYFTKADLRGNFDIVIIKGSMLPNSLTARYQTVMDLNKIGYYGQPGSRETMYKLRQHVGDGSPYIDAFEDTEADEKTAQKENSDMRAGKFPLPAEWEDHVVHIYIHNQDRKQPDYKDLPEHIRKLFSTHIELTEAMQQQRAQAQAQAQGAQNAQPITPPMPPGPQGVPNAPSIPIQR